MVDRTNLVRPKVKAVRMTSRLHGRLCSPEQADSRMTQLVEAEDDTEFQPVLTPFSSV